MKKIITIITFCMLLAIPTSSVGIGVSRVPLGKFKITAYHGSQVKSRKIPVTASGKVAASGRTIAVDPRVIPMGSVVEIEGVGTRIAEDTGGDIKGKRIDLYASSRHAALQFGVRRRNVFLVEAPRLGGKREK